MKFKKLTVQKFVWNYPSFFFCSVNMQLVIVFLINKNRINYLLGNNHIANYL